MGKRKKAAKKPTGPRKNEPLPTVFPCLFCNHEKSVTVKVDKKAGVGALLCKVCSQQFQCSVNYLSMPVDVYSDWVDACDAVAKEDGEERAAELAPSRAPAAGRPKGGREIEEDDDDDIIDDGSDGLGGYGGEGVVADDEY